MRELIILGAGANSRQIAWIVSDLARHGSQWLLRGYLDDNPALRGARVDRLPVLGPLDSIGDHADCMVVIGVANWKSPAARRAIAERLKLDPARYATLVHPSASVAPDVRLGRGTVVFPQAFIGVGARIGDHVQVTASVTVGHDCRVADFVTFAQGATVSGHAEIAAAAYVGGGAAVRERIRIGEAAVVGLGAVVVRDVPAGAVVAGNPARPLKPAQRATLTA